jgi:hypothetical protein
VVGRSRHTMWPLSFNRWDTLGVFLTRDALLAIAVLNFSLLSAPAFDPIVAERGAPAQLMAASIGLMTIAGLAIIWAKALFLTYAPKKFREFLNRRDYINAGANTPEARAKRMLEWDEDAIEADPPRLRTTSRIVLISVFSWLFASLGLAIAILLFVFFHNPEPPATAASLSPGLVHSKSVDQPPAQSLAVPISGPQLHPSAPPSAAERPIHPETDQSQQPKKAKPQGP